MLLVVAFKAHHTCSVLVKPWSPIADTPGWVQTCSYLSNVLILGDCVRERWVRKKSYYGMGFGN